MVEGAGHVDLYGDITLIPFDKFEPFFKDLEQYDTILLGYPIWGGQAPNILYTFLESIELRNVTVLPFCMSNMVSPGTSAIKLQALIQNWQS